MKNFFILTVFFGYACAVCPPVIPVSDLNLEKYMGTWQIHGVVNGSEPIGEVKCYMNNLSGKDLGIEPVALKGHLMGTFDGHMRMTDAIIKVKFLIQPGVWDWNLHGVQASASIMFTDYAEYSLLLICRDNGDDLEVHFMSRFHDPMPDNVIASFKDYLHKYGIDTTNFQSVIHDDSCGHGHNH